MINEVSVSYDTFMSHDTMGNQRFISGGGSVDVSMSFRGSEAIRTAVMEANALGEAEGLRHIADAIDAAAYRPPRVEDMKVIATNQTLRKSLTGKRAVDLDTGVDKKDR